MKKTILTSILSLLVAGYLSAQQLYMPRNIEQAFKKGTRSMDGKPGKNYWQNHGKYTMDIAVDATSKVVTGTEEIVYTNNSPDSLGILVIRFVNNLHKPTSPRSGAVGADFLSAGLTITSFSADGVTYAVDSKDWGTAEAVKLKQKVKPGGKITVNIGWSYPLSKESGREGQIDPNTFFVAYSYPRISVYDDYNGWDRVPHTDAAEFYNDFNDYIFTVKAPKNYVVWATGDLLNPDEVLNPEFAARLKKSYTSDEIMHIATAQEMKDGKVTMQNEWNAWKFSVSNIPDVCFGLSNHYLWDASSTIVDAKTGRRASTQAAYNVTGKDFVNSVKYNNYALAWFSNNWPGIPYPYSKMTAFQGFADMEYPMMTNDSNWNMDNMGRFVQDHEIAHTYFPFYMGINETRYAFMDEGWATALEYLIATAEHGNKDADANFKSFRVSGWIGNRSTDQDLPVITMTTLASGNNAYVKPALSYLALKDMLGDERFKKALHTYMDNWNGKHPIPWDYFNSMNTGSGQNLNWFFQNWFFTNHYIDLNLKNVVTKSGKSTITIENKGGFAIPFDVVITYNDGMSAIFHQTPEIWKANQKQLSITINTNPNIKSITLDGGIFMDATPGDNVFLIK